MVFFVFVYLVCSGIVSFFFVFALSDVLCLLAIPGILCCSCFSFIPIQMIGVQPSGRVLPSVCEIVIRSSVFTTHNDLPMSDGTRHSFFGVTNPSYFDFLSICFSVFFFFSYFTKLSMNALEP